MAKRTNHGRAQNCWTGEQNIRLSNLLVVNLWQACPLGRARGRWAEVPGATGTLDWDGRHGVGQWAATRRRSADVGPSGSAGGGVGTPARRRIADLRPRGWSTGERGRNPSTAGRADPRSSLEIVATKGKEPALIYWWKSAGTVAGWSVCNVCYADGVLSADVFSFLCGE